MRIGHGYDVHRLIAGRKLILGGVEIPYILGLDGHSDADVLLHAVMDALLGAAALGDIGHLFPDTDPAYKGISSLKLLAVVAAGMLIFDRPLFRKVDYGLLATFFCFFLFAGNVGACAPVREALTAVMAQNTALASGITSQVISNVPAAVLLSNFTTDWHGLLIGTNIGGLGTPIASLASLISMKAYLKSPGARAGRYLLVFTLANVAALAILTGSVVLMGLIFPG